LPVAVTFQVTATGKGVILGTVVSVLFRLGGNFYELVRARGFLRRPFEKVNGDAAKT
jgi:hypothetical protein